MITSRSRTSANICKRQRQRKFIDAASTGKNVPLSKVDWLERWCSLPFEDETILKKIYELQVRGDDVYVITFPKSGTTWIQEAAWLLCNNLDFDRANRDILIPKRSVFLDYSGLYSSAPGNSVEQAEEAKSPRVLKTHLPAHLIPNEIWKKKAKIIYCARNPKDTAISYFHFLRGLGTWVGDQIDDFVEDIINNDIMYSPYWEHLMEFWQMRHEENIFFTTYEAMKRNLRKVLIELNHFLEKPQLSDKDLEKLEEHLSFKKMKGSPSTNLTFSVRNGHGSPHIRSDFEYMRRGIVGAFKDELSHKTLSTLDNWTADNLKIYDVTLEDIFGTV
ncbi:sulfotransferase 1E1 [Stomoxys calcitrans]|uniref:sulfotransferase 1E1 n=1 Tax=Stomoxys calcitrans TaxID=35570 RepID=UPI0027E2F72F|nr:sulfotransferase 1E1 [Stomoxys calcitrans]